MLGTKPPKVIQRITRTVDNPELYNWVYIPPDMPAVETDDDAYRLPMPFDRMVLVGHTEDDTLMGYVVEKHDEWLRFSKIMSDNRKAFPTIQIDISASKGRDIEVDPHPDMTHVNMEPYDPENPEHKRALEDEVHMVWQLLCGVLPVLLSREERGITVYRAKKSSTLISKKREKKGKPPLLVWSTINLQSVVRAEPNIVREPTGETRISPREHERRGHYRTYKSGRQVWIKPQVINKGSERGRVAHVYKVSTQEN